MILLFRSSLKAGFIPYLYPASTIALLRGQGFEDAIEVEVVSLCEVLQGDFVLRRGVA